MSSGSIPAETAARSRTRRAIVAAALTTLAGSPGASLGEVAAAAGVGRTTLHRYFAERSDLIAAVGVEVVTQVREATDRARLEDGSAPDAIVRLAEEYFALGDVLAVVFTQPQLQSEEFWAQEPELDVAVTRAVDRGLAAGEIDSELDGMWVVHLVWTLLYTAWTYASESGRSRHAALTLALRTLRKSLAP